MENFSWLFDFRTLLVLKLVAIPIKLLLFKKAADRLPWRNRQNRQPRGLPPISDDWPARPDILKVKTKHSDLTPRFIDPDLDLPNLEFSE